MKDFRGDLNLVGNRFGKLTVVAYTKRFLNTSKTFRPAWQCICDCGKERFVFTSALLKGKTRSCGCIVSKAKSDAIRRVETVQRFDMTSAQTKEVNLARKEAGLPLADIKERRCLRCSRPFVSLGSGNRMCSTCRYMSE